MTTDRDVLAALAVALELLQQEARRRGTVTPAWVADTERTLRAIACDTERLTASSLLLLAESPHADDVFSYKPSEVAKLWSVSTRTIERLVASGELESVVIGSETRITHNAVVDFLDAKRRSFRDRAEQKNAAASPRPGAGRRERSGTGAATPPPPARPTGSAA